jgi:aspartyl-tRNA synthetase
VVDRLESIIKMFKNLCLIHLGLSKEDVEHRFGFFVDALKYGTPPHGGLALGLDRIVMLMTHTKTLKMLLHFLRHKVQKI